MTMNPNRPCRKCRRNVTRNESGYCDACEPKIMARKKRDRQAYDRRRGSACKRGYDRRWQKESKLFLMANPYCVDCEAMGIVKLAEVVDHIKPHKGDMELFWDVNNWQPMCVPCHSKKTAKEDGGFGHECK